MQCRKCLNMSQQFLADVMESRCFFNVNLHKNNKYLIGKSSLAVNWARFSNCFLCKVYPVELTMYTGISLKNSHLSFLLIDLTFHYTSTKDVLPYTLAMMMCSSIRADVLPKVPWAVCSTLSDCWTTYSSFCPCKLPWISVELQRTFHYSWVHF